MAMPNNANNFINTGLFRFIWTNEANGLAHRGLDEVNADGAERIVQYAMDHDLAGAPSTPQSRRIDSEERTAMREILEDDHYGAFFELEARPMLMERFGIESNPVKASSVPSHAVSTDRIDFPEVISKSRQKEIEKAGIKALPSMFAKEYAMRRAELEGMSVPPARRSLNVLGLFKSFTDALWSHGQLPGTERVENALLDELEKTRYGAEFGSKDFNGAGWSCVQSLVLGLDPNKFNNEFPKARPKAKTNYMSMDGGLAKAMKHVDAYRKAQGQAEGAEAFEKKSPLGYMIGAESGHTKFGNLYEKRPFASSGINWGRLLFPTDEQVKTLRPKPGFEFPIDCLDAFQQCVVADIEDGDQMIVRGPNGEPLQPHKTVHLDSNGRPSHWSAEFRNARSELVPPETVLGLIVDDEGCIKGSGHANSKLNMHWWGFCDRNTAQTLYKSKFGIPQLTAQVVKVKAKDSIIEFPRADAQDILDADVPDLIRTTSYCGFRFNGEPQTIMLKNGEIFCGEIQDMRLRNTSKSERLHGDKIRVQDTSEEPILGSIIVGDRRFSVAGIERIERKDSSSKNVAIYLNRGWQKIYTGKLETTVDWSKAVTEEGTEILHQDQDWPIRGDLEIELSDSSVRKVPANEVATITGETEDDVRISQYMVWVSQKDGLYASDSAKGVIVSNGVRWVNKIDIDERSDFDDVAPLWVKEELNGIHGKLVRKAGDKMLWVRGLYANHEDSVPLSAVNFSGWVQISRTGRIINEGFIRGAPDFAWSSASQLNWSAPATFNPYLDPDLRLSLLVNGVEDISVLEKAEKRLNLPDHWRTLRVDPTS